MIKMTLAIIGVLYGHDTDIRMERRLPMTLEECEADKKQRLSVFISIVRETWGGQFKIKDFEADCKEVENG